MRDWLQGATTAMLDAAGVGPGLRVLDIAAGTGDQTLDIARRVGPEGRVLATDLSARLVALADARLRLAGIENADMQVAEAQRLPLAGAGFDAAVCRLGLMFGTEPGQALRSVRAALRPGSRFSALVFGEVAANP